MTGNVRYITWAAIIAALYVILTLMLAPLAFGMVQLRVSESLTVLPIFTPAAIPGLILGCLISNLLNPQNLGPIDIVLGTAATGVAAYLSYLLGQRYRRVKGQAGKAEQGLIRRMRILALLPPIVINALLVGVYLPFLLLDQVTLPLVLLSILSIAISQALVVFAVGLPLVLAIERTPLETLMEGL